MHVSRICSDLVKIRSENPPGRTDEVIEYIRVFLERSGYQFSCIRKCRRGCAIWSPEKTGTRLLLCGHVDVVPALDTGWTYPPFSGRIDEQYVHGRGSTDMKGGCASILSACETMVNPGQELPATLVFVCDEETGGENGIRRLLADA